MIGPSLLLLYLVKERFYIDVVIIFYFANRLPKEFQGGISLMRYETYQKKKLCITTASCGKGWHPQASEMPSAREVIEGRKDGSKEEGRSEKLKWEGRS